ncbi:MAG: TetR/AcrR family transcriptional regulator [Pikeienuella sp.]
MPRPSLKDQRQTQILDAFVRVAARRGIEGATQTLIAQEAGVQRPILRHYLGNKDEMVAALLEHVLDSYEQLLTEFDDRLPDEISGSGLVWALLVQTDTAENDLALVLQTMIALAPTNPDLRTSLINRYDRFYGILAGRLQGAHPEASVADCAAVARGIGALYLEQEAADKLSPPDSWRTDRIQAANLLVSTLLN